MTEGNISIVNIHTPQTSFAIVHSFTQETLENLFLKLTHKISASLEGRSAPVGQGWVKYDWDETVWNLDDDSDYTILAWRLKSFSEAKPEFLPTLYLHNPSLPLPSPPEYCNPAYYSFKRPTASPPSSHRPNSRGGSRSVRSGRSRRSRRSAMSHTSEEDDGVPKFKKEFLKFHNENGVKTIIGSIGPVKDVRMLLKNGYRHVYISRSFAKKHNFIPKDAAPGLYGYEGLVNLGQWPITVGKTKTMHSVYLSEENHFDCILGRSFMERRAIKIDPIDPTNVVCLDTGEKLDCELVIIRDGNGEIVTVT